MAKRVPGLEPATRRARAHAAGAVRPRASGLLLAAALAASACAGPAVRPPPRDALLARPFRPFVPPPEGRPDLPPLPEAPPDDAWPPSRDARDLAFGRELASAATAMLGRRRPVARGRRYRADCSGFAQAVFAARGVDLFADGPASPSENGVAIIHRFVARHGHLHHGPPEPGDLVFFHDSWDRNGDGRRNDPLTHVAVVESVEADGTVVMVHHVHGRVRRLHMSLSRPGEVRDPKTGRRLNDYLRREGRHRLTSDLFAGYGTLPPDAAAPPAVARR